MFLKVAVYVLIAVLLFVVVGELLRVVLIRVRAGAVLEDAKKYEQAGDGLSILVAGDSTGYGTGASKPELSVAGRLGTMFPNADIENVSQNGHTLAEVLEEVHDAGRYDVILLQVGGNDILQFRSAEQIEKDTRALLTASKERAEHVFFMSTGNVGGAPGFGPLLSYIFMKRTLIARDIFMDVSNEVGVTYIDLYEPPEEDVFQLDPKKYHADDGVHPSSAGYGEWFRKLREVINQEDLAK